MPIKPGEVIAGKYVIERLLGQGGMGAVFVAMQEELGRRVAIKFLLGNAMLSADAVARFEREGRAAAALQSDHVTRVLDVGRLASGAPYIVMELLDGEDLADALQRRGPLPLGEAVGAIVQACDAIAEAHALGIVHRDLKPANLFLARRANGSTSVKVLDFGISKTREATGKALTSTAALMGSPQYMSPEQLREARNVDGRADIWALGVTLHELLTQRLPFECEALAQLCALILTAPHAPLRMHQPELPADIEAVVSRCLQKDPQHRYATVEELVAALAAVQMPVRASQPQSKVVIKVPSFAQTSSPVDGDEDTRRKSIDTFKVSEPRAMAATEHAEARSPKAATVDPVSSSLNQASWSAPQPERRSSTAFSVAIGVVLVGVALKLGVGAFGHRPSPGSVESIAPLPAATVVALPVVVDAAVGAVVTPPIPLPERTRPRASPSPAPKSPSGKAPNPLDLEIQ